MTEFNLFLGPLITLFMLKRDQDKVQIVTILKKESSIRLPFERKNIPYSLISQKGNWFLYMHEKPSFAL